jgi:chromate transporter
VVGVILNLAVWFGIHVIFRDIFVWQGFGFNLSIPVLSSLAIAAAVAIFRCKVGIMHTLLACSLAGVALQLAFGVAS